MLKQSDLPYFRNREQIERRAAAGARDLASRAVHLRLAEHYADRVWALEEQSRRKTQSGRPPVHNRALACG